jgi:hypothetical protein
MESRRFEADGNDYKGPERGWCIGSEKYLSKLLERQISNPVQPDPLCLAVNDTQCGMVTWTPP